MNLSCTLHRRCPAVSHPAGHLVGRRRAVVRRVRAAGRLHRRRAARPARPGARRPRRAGDGELPRSSCPLLYGIWRAGLSAVPMNSKLHPKEMAWIMANSQSRLCIASPKLAERCPRPASAPCRRSLSPARADTRALLHGDAVAPRARRSRYRSLDVLHQRHHRAARRARCSATATCCSPATATTPTSIISARSDTILHAAPLTHGSGLYGLAHIARGSQQRHPARVRSSPSRCSTRLAATATSACSLRPTMVARLINHPGAGSADTRGLKTIIYGGAPDVPRRPEARAHAVRAPSSTISTARARAR